jgi:saccharopine dehydrogenase-like NADP-dependent oxidoreductase
MPIFLSCEIENTNYIDMAMSLSRPHPHYPNSETGVKLGDEQFARDWNWGERQIYALVGMGIEPGMSDVLRVTPKIISLVVSIHLRFLMALT